MRRREKGRREKEEGEDKRRTGEWIQGAHYHSFMLEKNHSFSATTTNTTTATTTSLVPKKLDKKHTANP